MSTQMNVECDNCGRPAGSPARLRLDLGEDTVCDLTLCFRCVVPACRTLAEEMANCWRQARAEAEGLRRMAGGRRPGVG
jgi:hypothetical protein